MAPLKNSSNCSIFYLVEIGKKIVGFRFLLVFSFYFLERDDRRQALPQRKNKNSNEDVPGFLACIKIIGNSPFVSPDAPGQLTHFLIRLLLLCCSSGVRSEQHRGGLVPQVYTERSDKTSGDLQLACK